MIADARSYAGVPVQEIKRLNKAIHFLQERYQAGVTIGKHSRSHDGKECEIILKGRLEETVSGRKKYSKRLTPTISNVASPAN